MNQKRNAHLEPVLFAAVDYRTLETEKIPSAIQKHNVCDTGHWAGGRYFVLLRQGHVLRRRHHPP